MSPRNRSEEGEVRHDSQEQEEETKLIPGKLTPRKYEIVKFNVFLFGYFHLAALYGLYLAITSAKWATIFFGYFLFEVSIIGITAGAHRYWTHRTYKAKMPLQIILLICNSVAFQNTAADWVRDHRLHHKYSDTDADPHNSTRGLFYSQIGWLMCKKHPEVTKKGKTIDISDIKNDPVLQFQKKYAIPFIGALCFVIPTLIPMYFWGESLNNSFHVSTMLRYVMNFNITFLVNSIGHCWGYRPYDKNIKPVENLSVALITLGEGFHNYHHVFPYDYKTAELGNTKFNFTTMFINFFAWIGWAYDLKTVPEHMVKARSMRTGEEPLWGWGDKDQSAEEREAVEILNSSNKK